MNALRGFSVGLFITAVCLALWGPGVHWLVIFIGGGWLSSLIWLLFEMYHAQPDPWEETK